MELWDEMRTAMVLAKTGTVMGTAEQLGIHRATVTRHVDALEAYLDRKLFLRHRDGYSPTNDGTKLVSLASATEGLLESFVSELGLEQLGISGTLKVSTLGAAFSHFAPAVREFSQQHPKVSINLSSAVSVPKLALGEADVAIMFGRKPSDLDYVVLRSHEFSLGLCGHALYLEKRGVPATKDDLASHDLIAVETQEGSLDIVEYFDALEERIKIRSNDPATTFRAIEQGLGLGLATHSEIRRNVDLVEVLPRKKPVIIPVWVVTHVDAHRSKLITAFVAHIREFAKQSLFDVRRDEDK